MFNEFIRYGRLLFQEGLVSSHSGNISRRQGDAIYITRHGARLGDLEYSDIVRVHMEASLQDKAASVEVAVHRAIYQATPAEAIVHAHPPLAIALSIDCDQLRPLDAEGKYYLPVIPVLTVQDTIGTEGSIRLLPPVLKENRVVVIKGHGSFSVGQSIEEACQWTAVLESVCRIIYYRETYRKNS